MQPRKPKGRQGNVLANYQDIAVRCSALLFPQNLQSVLCASGHHRENGDLIPNGLPTWELCVNSALSSFPCKTGHNPAPAWPWDGARQEPLRKDGWAVGLLIAVLLELQRRFQGLRGVATL